MAVHLELNVDEKSVLPLAKGLRKDIEHSFLPYMEKKNTQDCYILALTALPRRNAPHQWSQTQEN